jgi:glc operon protein GlcG
VDETFLSRNHIKLSTKGSHVVVHAAERAASALGVPQCIAVVDEGGRLLAFSRMDGARIGSIEIAIAKAVSAATRLRPTAEEGAGDVLPQLRIALASKLGVTGIPGGLPIIVDGQVIGGVGVSSGTSEQDLQVGQAGIDALLAA